MADSVVKCPWCYEPVALNLKDLSDPRAEAHLNRCQVLNENRSAR